MKRKIKKIGLDLVKEAIPKAKLIHLKGGGNIKKQEPKAG